MKKYIVIVAVLIIATLAFLFLKSKDSKGLSVEMSDHQTHVVEFEDTPAAKVEAVTTSDDAEDESSQIEDSNDLPPTDFQVLSDEELERRLEAKEEEFDRLEEEWLENVKTLFVSELGLSEEQYKDYLNLREGLFNDKIEAFEDMHKQLEAKHGENYVYNPTEEELKFDKEIQKKYDEVLMKKIGKPAFIKYLELRDRTNEKILEKTSREDAAMLMEF